MNNVANYSEDTSRFSPNYRGEVCKHCGRTTDTDEDNLCEDCEETKCYLCGEKIKLSEAVWVDTETVCTDCVIGCEAEDGVSVHEAVRHARVLKLEKQCIILNDTMLHLSIILDEAKQKYSKTK